MHRFFTLFLAFLFILPSPASDCDGRYVEDIFEIEAIRDVQFGRSLQSNGTWLDLKMNIYVPKNDYVTNRPLLLYMHGGSFISGNYNMFESNEIAKALAKKGFVTVSPAYRQEDNYLSLIFPEVMIKAVIRAVHDAKAAVRFFRKDVAENGNTYGIDPDRIFIGGASAGAIAAIHLAYLDDLSELDNQFLNYINQLGGIEGESGNPGYNSEVRGVISVAGAIKDRNYMRNNTDIPILCIHSTNDLSIPYTYGHPYFIPTLPIVHGGKHIDTYARNNGLKSTLYSIPGFAHIPYGNSPDTYNPVVFDSSIRMMSAFMRENIACGGTPTPVRDKRATELNIYPNPSSGTLYLQENPGIGTIYRVTLSNILGQQVWQSKEYPAQQPLDLKAEGVTTGLYILQGWDKQGLPLGTTRIVVQ